MILAATLKDAIVFVCGYVLIFTVILAVITLIIIPATSYISNKKDTRHG